MNDTSIHCSTISWIALVGSISIANRLSNPLTFVASFENFWPKASDKLCAGSVDCSIHGQLGIKYQLNMTQERTIRRTD